MVKTAKSFSIMLKYLLQMHFKLLKKEQFQKQHKQLVT